LSFQYGVQARYQSIAKLREAEEGEEVALKNYEYLSNYAAESLDVFLRVNEEAKNQASKMYGFLTDLLKAIPRLSLTPNSVFNRAEEKLKENIILSDKARILALQTNSMKADIAGLNENLRECKFYMQFLDNVARELMRRDEEEKYRTERVRELNCIN